MGNSNTKGAEEAPAADDAPPLSPSLIKDLEKSADTIAKMAWGMHDYFYTVRSMEDGGCVGEFRQAKKTCAQLQRLAKNGSGKAGDKEACFKATEALRKCIMANDSCPTFRNYLRTLDAGLEENERRGCDGIEFAENQYGRVYWRWWCDMRRK